MLQILKKVKPKSLLFLVVLLVFALAMPLSASAVVEPAETSVDVTKKWVGDPADEVTFNLDLVKKDWSERTRVDSVTLSLSEVKSHKWQHTFTNLTVPAPGYKYVVWEKTPPGYQKEVSGNAQDGYVFTNTKLIDDFRN